MKSSKKKVLIAAVLAGVLLLGAIVSVVLVLAAQQQNISSNIRITYSVDGVGAKVSAKYGSVPASGIVNMSDMTTLDGVSTELNFSVSDTNGGASLTPNGDIELTQTTGTEVVFEYRFENTADTLFTIGMKSTGTAVNIAEYYYVSTEPLAEAKYGKIAEPLLNGTTAGELVIPKQAMLSTTTPGNVIYIYVKVAVANINKGASYEKNYNWELKQLTTEQVPFDLALDNGDGSGENSVKVIKGAVVPVMASLPSAPASKGFAGYYDAQTDGNLIVSKNGIGVKEISSETTLYARYDEASVLDTTGTTLFGFNPTASATTATMTALEVPAEITEIAPSAFENNTKIESVTIGGETTQATGYATGSALKKIGAKAFKGCTNLTEVIFADNIAFKTIGSEAFKGCTGLTELNLPASVNEAKTDFVAGCTGLTKISLSADLIPAGTSSSKCGLEMLLGDIYSQITEVELTGGTIVNNYAFYYCSESLTSVTIPESVTTIGEEAFSCCFSLTSITIPDSVTTIGEWAFSSCTSLTTITIPNSVTSIGSSAFYNCSKLKKVNITDLATWCNISFSNHHANPLYFAMNLYIDDVLVTELEIPSLITEIKSYAFNNCTSLTEITIPNSVTSIGYNAFSNCSKLTKVNIIDLAVWYNISFSNYYANPLYYAKNLYIDDVLVTGLEIPSLITEIKSYAFYNCTSLTSVTLGDSVTSIGDFAFSGCTGLTTITIPNSVTSIGSSAFYNCTGLTSITIPNSVTTIGGYAFDCCINLSTVTFENTTGWKIYQYLTTTGYAITVTNATTNATNLKNTSSSPSSPSTSATNWGRWYLKRSA